MPPRMGWNLGPQVQTTDKKMLNGENGMVKQNQLL